MDKRRILSMTFKTGSDGSLKVGAVQRYFPDE